MHKISDNESQILAKLLLNEFHIGSDFVWFFYNTLWCCVIITILARIRTLP